ncbi:MAG: cyclic nucleotide-binding domain-containing protein [Magnetococcus sp. MYC-9]
MREMSHLTHEQRLDLIRHLPFFAPFDEDEQRLFAGDCARVFCYYTGEFLIQEGADDHSLFILLIGAASVVKEGSAIPFAQLGPGHMFGEVGFLMQHRRTSNVIVHPASPAADKVPDQETERRWRALHALPGQTDPHATAVAILFHQSLLQQLAQASRIKLKQQIIQCLTARVDSMHEQLARLTGEAPLLSMDDALDFILNHPQPLSLESLERTKERIIAQLVGFMEELNRLWISAPLPLHV